MAVSGWPSVAPTRNNALKDFETAGLDPYWPFVRDSFVFAVGSEVTVPVTIPRDTEDFDSFILAGLLPFANTSDTGHSFPEAGID